MKNDFALKHVLAMVVLIRSSPLTSLHDALQQLTCGQQGDESAERATVVSPAMQAEHRSTLVRTPHCASDLPPRDFHS